MRFRWVFRPDLWIGESWALAFFRLVGSSTQDSNLSFDIWQKFPYIIAVLSGHSYLLVIEREIHTSKNRVERVMNGALIAIGGRDEALRRKSARPRSASREASYKYQL